MSASQIAIFYKVPYIVSGTVCSYMQQTRYMYNAVRWADVGRAFKYLGPNSQKLMIKLSII